MTDIFAKIPEVLGQMGIVPHDMALYQRACIHRSFLNESPKDNEELQTLI